MRALRLRIKFATKDQSNVDSRYSIHFDAIKKTIRQSNKSLKQFTTKRAPVVRESENILSNLQRQFIFINFHIYKIESNAKF